MSSSEYRATATIPTGWTGGREYLFIDYFWTGKDSILCMLQDDYGLPNVEPIIARGSDFGDMVFLVESAPDGKPDEKTYYIWNAISFRVFKVDDPKDLNGIYTALDAKEGGLGGLKLLRVYEMA